MELDIQQLMLSIKESAAKRKPVKRYSRPPVVAARAFTSSKNASHSLLKIGLPALRLSPEFKNRKDNRYHVDDLLKYHDQEFVRNAYQAILKREPDGAGQRGYLEGLRSGRFNKIDILASLHSSAEGKKRNVKVDGLMFPATVRRLGRVPVLGYVFQVVIGILRLPSAIRERRRFESYSIIQQQELAGYGNRLGGFVNTLSDFVNELPARMEQQQQELKTLLEQHQQHLTTLLEQQQQKLALQENVLLTHESALQAQKNDALGHANALLEHANALLEHANALRVQENALAELSKRAVSQRDFSEGLSAQLLDDQKKLRAQSEAADRLSRTLKQVRTDLTTQQARDASLISAVNKKLSLADSSELSGVFKEEDSHLLDGLYMSLEDHFRGDKSELKEKFKVYLPYLKLGEITADILDIGCGRGEWLELLREEGFQAKGVDENRSMAEHCRESGLEVVCGNALDYLRSLPDNGFRAITSFHVIEHLEFKALMELIDEIIRTLKPGGLLIFETPNPENVVVATCNFYLDPSHRRPLPSQIMRFLLEARGLTDLEVVGLHPLESSRIEGDTELIHRFNDIFYGPMDYAIIARKI